MLEGYLSLQIQTREFPSRLFWQLCVRTAIEEDSISSPFNRFMNVRDGRHKGRGSAGDHVDLFDAMDFIAAFAACSAERPDAGSLKPVQYRVTSVEVSLALFLCQQTLYKTALETKVTSWSLPQPQSPARLPSVHNISSRQDVLEPLLLGQDSGIGVSHLL